MMQFSEKLSFLMHITETSNKALAAELSIDPSMVSLMRTGKRKLSKNPVQAKKMALYFAHRCPAAFQRQALSEMLGQASISPSMPVDAVAACLERWLRGENDMAGAILSGLETFPKQAETAHSAPFLPVPPPSSDNQTLFFYGVEGRREVMCRVMQEIQRMDSPSPILTVVDDNLEWLLSDYQLTKAIRSGLVDVMERGFTFYQIMPPLNFINRYTESLQFWLPMYATGQMKVYYYPRLRGNLYRHSMIVVPGRCVQYASSVGAGSTSDITMFSTDPQLVQAFEKQFRQHIALCRPALHVHDTFADSMQSCLKFFSCQGDTIEIMNTLPLGAIPRELAAQFMQESEQPHWKELFQMYLDTLPHFEAYLAQNNLCIDMCCIPPVEKIRSGVVPVGTANEVYPGQPYYTPEAYCLHLKNILRLMDQYENYCFLPMQEKDAPDYNLFVKEGSAALIVRTSSPVITMEVLQPPMVTAFREHLLRKAEAVGYDGIQREKIRMTLRSLIQELGG